MHRKRTMPRREDNIVSLRPQTKDRVLERLFNEHKDSLRAFLRGRLRDYADAEDVLQDVFTRLARIQDLPQQLKTPVSDCRPYLFTIANNVIIDRERHKAIRRRYLEAESRGGLDVYEITPEMSVEGIQDLEVLEKAIVKLPDNWRKAFVLSRFQYMSYQEIADRMGVTTRSIENYMAKAIAELRKAMKKVAGEKS